MIELRKNHEALTSGEFIPFYQEEMFGYLRKTEEECHLILVNSKPEKVRTVLADVIGLENMSCDISAQLGEVHHLEPYSFTHRHIMLK